MRAWRTGGLLLVLAPLLVTGCEPLECGRYGCGVAGPDPLSVEQQLFFELALRPAGALDDWIARLEVAGVGVWLGGDVTAADEAAWSEHARTLTHLTGRVFTRADSADALWHIFFLPNDRFPEFGYNSGLYGLCDAPPTEDDNGVRSLADATIMVHSGIGVDSSRSNTLLHEMVHCVGLYNHTTECDGCILNRTDSWRRPRLSAADSFVITTLYDDRLVSGMTKPEIREALDW